MRWNGASFIRSAPVVLFAVEVLGVATILVIVFGVPTNFATALGLVGAGLAVGLQDFIVGFFGWFVLIGKDGVRSGDWVEINGIGGEVLELGLFHTVILETGSDAGRLTGRKVSFVNSYAVQGPLFQFLDLRQLALGRSGTPNSR